MMVKNIFFSADRLHCNHIQYIFHSSIHHNGLLATIAGSWWSATPNILIWKCWSCSRETIVVVWWVETWSRTDTNNLDMEQQSAVNTDPMTMVLRTLTCLKFRDLILTKIISSICYAWSIGGKWFPLRDVCSKAMDLSLTIFHNNVLLDPGLIHNLNHNFWSFHQTPPKTISSYLSLNISYCTFNTRSFAQCKIIIDKLHSILETRHHDMMTKEKLSQKRMIVSKQACMHTQTGMAMPRYIIIL